MKIDTGPNILICPTCLVANCDIALQEETIEATIANGSAICLDKSAILTLMGKNFLSQQKFYLSDDLTRCLIGMDFLRAHNAIIDANNITLTVTGIFSTVFCDQCHLY